MPTEYKRRGRRRAYPTTEGPSPMIGIRISKDTKSFLEAEANRLGVTTAKYCMDVLEAHVDKIIEMEK